MAVVIRMPEVLTGSTEAVLLSWRVEVGDVVAVGQPLAEVETEKAIVEYEAEEAGTLVGLLAQAGESVEVGTPIAVLAGAGESADEAMAQAGADPTMTGPAATAAPSAPTAATAAPQPSEAPSAAPEPAIPPGAAAEVAPPPPIALAPTAGTSAIEPQASTRVLATPLVRRLARERGLDLSAVRGSGPGSRIVRRDIDGLAASPAAPVAAAPVAAAPVAPPVGPLAMRDAVEESTPAPESNAPYADIAHTGMRRAIARRLTESKSTIPHFYLVADCQVDALIELRRSVNALGTAKVSLNDFVVKAVAAAFGDVPAANAIWTADATRRFDSVDIAVAVAVDGGLVTPVVRGVEKRSLSDIGATMVDLVARGRAGKLKQHELEGGSFAISNLGMFGIERFSAIINPPQSGILAVGAATQRPVVADGELAVATVMTVTLSGDHRVLDGALAARWLAAFVKRVENPLSILI